MCGISGIVHFSADRPIDRTLLTQMTDALVHRGPDGSGYHVQQNVGLGHRRLAIIDLSTGDQPIYNHDKSLAIVFNGELYNYVEVREELKGLGHQFQTASDTEVVLKGYEQWGPDCLNRFNGMWAMAIADHRKKGVFLSIDRIGEKPLYYSEYDQSLLFGSEIKSILAYGHPAQADESVLDLYLSLCYIPAPYTYFKGIKKLQPGHYLWVENGNVQEHQYWDLPEVPEADMLRDKTQVYAQFEELFSDAVRLQMQSDVPFGAFLSGGLDSSSIVALMSARTKLPIETFTIGYEHQEYDERDLAKEVAQAFGTNHHEHLVDEGHFEEAWKKVLHHYDEPFGDSSAIPTGYVSKFASKQVKMVLTGDAGDEVLCGYTSFQGQKFAEQYQQLPGFLRKGMPAMVGAVASATRGGIRYKLNRAEKVLRDSNRPFLDRMLTKAKFAEPDLINGLLEDHKVVSTRDFVQDVMANCHHKDGFYRLMYYNFKVPLTSAMMVKVDRMSMAHSLETRVPFLDYRLVEFMAGVHKNLKMEGYERKSILRNTVGQKLPQSLLSASKKGFRVPVREWFKQPHLAEELKSMVKRNGLLNPTPANQLIDDNAAGKKDYGNFVWMLYILHKWHEKHT